MKKIFLFGSIYPEDSAISTLLNSKDLMIEQYRDASELHQALSKHSDDILLCTGTLGKDENGNYYLTL